MIKLNEILSVIILSAGVSLYASAAEDGVDRTEGFREAMGLYDKEMYSRSRKIFDKVGREGAMADPAGYALLCDVMSAKPGYGNSMEKFVSEFPYSSLIPQLRFYHALNLFDAQDYAGAYEVFVTVREKSLYREQRTEFVFKKAYCCLEIGDLQMAREGFAEVSGRTFSDYTSPSRYGLGYVEYQLRNFPKAAEWFGQTVSDVRFADMSAYYILECRFMMKDYDYVISVGPGMYESVPQDRKAHLARIVSESFLVNGQIAQARKFYELSLTGGAESNTRADWFYSGSMLYAVGDYRGAVENFTRMGERRDSIGQIASYNLGYSYIQTKDKVSAMGAFKEASELSFDDRIAEDAYFNYAKLAFDLNSDISGFNGYMKRYSSAGKAEQIYSYMAIAALHEHDYESAIQAYDKIDDLDGNMRLNYMKANYLRANQLVRSGSYRKAVPCLKAAAYYSVKNSRINQLSRFWLAEAYYRNDQYAESRALFTELYNASALYGQPEFYLLPYNIAYCYFKEGNYTSAKRWFGEYLGGMSVKYRKEALVRKADCDFVAKNYGAAAAGYDMVVRDYFDVNDIYPYYQAAISFGLVNDQDRKVELLSNVFEASSEAGFYPEALYELGRTYAVKEDDDNAYRCFNMIVDSVKDSTYVAQAYVEMGSIARNQSMFNQALGYYKIVVEQMPLSEYADDALLAIEAVYQTKNEPHEYLRYIESIGRGGIKSEDEKEAMIFNSAEQICLSGNYEKALVALQAYMEQYPEGKNRYKADFYMGESYKALGKREQACDSYEKVIRGGEGSFVELSVLNFAGLSFELERWADAYGAYASLLEMTKFESNRYLALCNMMRAAFRNHDWEKAADVASKVLVDGLADDRAKTEAEYIKARSFLVTGMRDAAFALFEKLSRDLSGSYGAESAYRIIQDCYDRGEFQMVEDKVYAFADAGSGQTYWLAKSFVVLGDSFMERDEVEQAKATFESVRDGYQPVSEGDDVLDSVRMRLEKIAQMSSVQ